MKTKDISNQIKKIKNGIKDGEVIIKDVNNHFIATTLGGCWAKLYKKLI